MKKTAIKLLAAFIAGGAWMGAHADDATEQEWAMKFVAASERVDMAKHSGYPMDTAESLLMKVPALHVHGEEAKADKYLATASNMADWYLEKGPSPFFE